MSSRLSSLIARLRDHVQADGAGAGLLDPLLRAATVERGKTWPTWAFVARRGLTAGAGPFRGLRYPAAVAPRIPGLAGRLGGGYEVELHPAIESIIARDPQLVVNVGSGDGYYSVGFALRCPGARVVAFEIEPYPARVAAAVAAANGVAARIEQRGGCTREELAALEPAGRTVLVCDAEGAEADLIDPAEVPWLRGAELLIEVHETFRPGVGDELARRLSPSHELEWIAPAARHLEDLPMFWDLPLVSETQTESLYSELRLWRTSWLHAVP